MLLIVLLIRDREENNDEVIKYLVSMWINSTSSTCHNENYINWNRESGFAI